MAVCWQQGFVKTCFCYGWTLRWRIGPLCKGNGEARLGPFATVNAQHTHCNTYSPQQHHKG